MTGGDAGRSAQGAIEPPLGPLERAASLSLGVAALNIVGVAPVLLGALQEQRRLDASGIGLAAMLELLAMGLSTGLFGALVPPAGLRRIGLAAVLALGVVDALCAEASGPAILALRAAAGLPEGALLWITVGMIARSATPERWAAAFFTAQVLAQAVLAALFWLWVLPRFGAAGGFWTLTAATALAAPAALLTPSRYGPLAQGVGLRGAPPPWGWAALAATAVFVSANGAVSVYLEPLGRQAGLTPGVVRLALVASLGAQIAGGAAATALAGRIRYLAVFFGGAAAYLAVWLLYWARPTALVFVLATTAAGAATLFVSPFLTPMTIAADPSRRAALQSAGAQIFGAAAGPFAAALIVGDADVRGVLAVAAVALLAGLAMICAVAARDRS